jgi:Fe-S cluster assembly protein SufB
VAGKSSRRGLSEESYRGLVEIREGAEHSRSTVKCDALVVDTVSRSDTYPYVDMREDDVEMGHKATVSKVSEWPGLHRLPTEYALELNRLIELQMEGTVG